MRRCLARRQPGPYQIQAAINAVHSDAATAAQTDWAQILALYDQLMAMAPTPVVALNRAVAVAEVHGSRGGAGSAERAATSTATTSTTPSAPTCWRAPATKDGAAAAYDAAIALTDNEAERRPAASSLRRRRRSAIRSRPAALAS